MSGKGRYVEAAIIALAIAARVAAVLVLRNHEVPRSTYEHGEIAANLLAGRGFSMRFLGADGPTSQQAPVYPILVAAAYAIGGVGDAAGPAAPGAGTMPPGRTPRLGRHAARPGDRAGPLRHGGDGRTDRGRSIRRSSIRRLTSRSPDWPRRLLVWTLVWAYRTGASGRPSDAAITGAFLGLLALIDPILALATIGITWAVWQGRRGLRESLRLTFRTMTVVARWGSRPGWCATALRPRRIRRHQEHVRLRLLAGQLCPERGDGQGPACRRSSRSCGAAKSAKSLSGLNRTLWEARHEAGYIDDIALTRADKHRLGSFSEPERSRILFRRALAELAADPWRYPGSACGGSRYFVLFDETNPKSRLLAYRPASPRADPPRHREGCSWPVPRPGGGCCRRSPPRRRSRYSTP